RLWRGRLGGEQLLANCHDDYDCDRWVEEEWTSHVKGAQYEQRGRGGESSYRRPSTWLVLTTHETAA
ncbi:MAG: hypothetical protein ABGY42_10195, partial [bacterium]